MRSASFLGQYALLTPKFPSVTPKAVDAMHASLDADPHGTGKTPVIDVAVYYAALFQRGAHNMDAAIKTLVQDSTATTLHSMFQQSYACANIINALTLLGQGGLMPQLHFDEARATAITENAAKGAHALHAPNAEAKKWVLDEWKIHKAEYKNNKTAFAKKYAEHVKQKYPKARAGFDTIKDDWLPKG